MSNQSDCLPLQITPIIVSDWLQIDPLPLIRTHTRKARENIPRASFRLSFSMLLMDHPVFYPSSHLSLGADVGAVVSRTDSR